MQSAVLDRVIKDKDLEVVIYVFEGEANSTVPGIYR